MRRDDDKRVLAEAWPYIRSAAALLIFLFRKPTLADSISSRAAYEFADEFIEQLKKDMDV